MRIFRDKIVIVKEETIESYYDVCDKCGIEIKNNDKWDVYDESW